ncbi:hypothetical protein KC622_03500 [Candidatus Dojkabacteria bacterium]|uniref:Endonuclease/exonuclease/phosphatase domain-containing protein n=1 Tax=Candidatus Dojkabacteria bacterium TaxID=2099670 RepID=A0A955HXU7_9BACT|nr:hypothetical protein [Candidatus Dojkabacteria bacterium]
MKVIFANVAQGFVYTDDPDKAGGILFKKFSIPDYVVYFKRKNPDILCLSEALINDEEGNSEFVDTIAKATGLNHVKVFRSEKSWMYIGKHYGLAILSHDLISKRHFPNYLNREI